MGKKTRENIQDAVTCLKCGTVAFSVSLEYMADEIKRFNEYYESLSKKDKSMFGGRSKVRGYIQCWCGNPYTNFRKSKRGDCPDGCTLSPILHRDE